MLTSPIQDGKWADTILVRFSNRSYFCIYRTLFLSKVIVFCIPILEDISNLKLNLDFTVGYSPERINPGDNNRKLTDIKKITSGSNAKALKVVDGLYKAIIKAGTHPVNSIKVAEAAKVIENTQRDINIALVNELSLLFKRLEIDTNEV